MVFNGMHFDFWNWFGTLNPAASIGLTILAVTLGILVLVGIYYLLKAIIKGIIKGSKNAAKGLTQGLEKARAKVEAKRPEIRAKLEQAKLKIAAAFDKFEQKLDDAFNGKSPAPVSTPASPQNVPTATEAIAPEAGPEDAPTQEFEFSPEKLPQYCAHCGAQFTETMLQRVAHDLPAFCARCGMKHTPTTGPSYQKLVDEVLQP